MFVRDFLRLITVTVMGCSVLAFGSSQRASEPSALTKLIVGTKHVPPFVTRNPDGSWSGISIELWRQIANQLDLDYEFRELTLKELLHGLETQSIHAAVAALTVTAKREETIDFTHPFHTTGLGIAVSRTHKRGWLTVVERFLSWSFFKVLLALAMVLFIAGMLVWFFEKRANVEQFGGRIPKGLGAAFWWSAVTMTTVGYGDKAPKTMGGRLVALIWMFTSVIIISSFTAAIASSLTVTQLEAPVRGPEDLPKVRVATVRASTSEDYLKQERISFTVFEAPLDAMKAIDDARVDAVLYDAPVLRYLAKKELQGAIEVLPYTFDRQYYAIGLPEGSALREPINRVLVAKTSAPEWKDIIYQYLGE